MEMPTIHQVPTSGSSITNSVPLVSRFGDLGLTMHRPINEWNPRNPSPSSRNECKKTVELRAKKIRSYGGSRRVSPTLAERNLMMSKLSTLLASAGLVIGIGLLAGPASAGPLGNLGGLQQQANPAVESVGYRRYSHRGCWRHRGHWHCPRYRRYSYYDYGYPYYDAYYGGPYYGYGWGPSVAFSFGGGRHWGGGHRFHGGRGFVGGRGFHGGRGRR
jgi:hypothetical protein